VTVLDKDVLYFTVNEPLPSLYLLAKALG